MASQNTLKQIQQILQQLQINIDTLNKAKSQITKKQKSHSITVPKLDKKKILKLFRYSNWQQFMKWTNEKLAQSGQIQVQVKQVQKQEDLSQLKSKLKSTHCNGQFQDTLNFELSEESHEQKRSVHSSNYKGERKNLFHNITIKKKQDQELQLLALQNGRLRRQNIILKNKLIQIHAAINE